MRELLLLAIVITVGAYVVVRMRMIEEKLALLRRSVDRQLSEADIEYLVKTVRENTADALEQRLKALEAQLGQRSACDTLDATAKAAPA